MRIQYCYKVKIKTGISTSDKFLYDDLDAPFVWNALESFMEDPSHPNDPLSHSGKLDGPMGSKPTSKHAKDTYEMTQEGWSKIDFNWAKDGPTKAAFYGCNTGADPDGAGPKTSFTTKLSAMNNFKDVFVWGQTSSSYPSMYTDVRDNNRAMMNGSFTTPTYMVAAGSLGIYGRFFPTSTSANPRRISRNGIGSAYNDIGQLYYQPGRKKKRR